MIRRPTASFIANPVLVGAVTTLVVTVAVFLAYNANHGLPFVPTRELKVQLRSGSNLVVGNDIREGGYRIGIVSGLKPVTLPGGQTITVATLKLDKGAGSIPADSRVTVRQRSALGLKFIDLQRGRSSRRLADGATLALSHTTVPVQIDELFRLFDAPTRRASRANLVGFGDALAGRGADLNRTLEALPGLFGDLRPVAGTLADPRTHLDRFVRELNRAARIIAPVASVNSRLFTDMATTFRAISARPGALRDTIAKSPGTLGVATDSLRVQRPFLADTAAVSTDRRVAAHDLRGAVPTINSALETGTPILRRTVGLDERTGQVLAAVRDLTRAPATTAALRGLTATLATLLPQLRFLAPYQTVCDDWNYWWTYLAEHITQPDPTGTAERVLLVTAANQENGMGTPGATEAANGEGYVQASSALGDPAVLHGRTNSAAIDSHGNADCEIGQTGYERGPGVVFAPKKDVAGHPIKVILDPHLPGDQGPTYQSIRNGIFRVPKGETFSAEPERVGQLPPEVREP